MEKELDLLVQSFEQLEELKRKLQTQQAASEHLKNVSEALAGVTEEIGKLPDEFQKVVERAVSTEERLKVASLSAQALMDSMPGIIERIERSDFSESISLLLKEISNASSEVIKLRSMISDVHSAAASVTESAEHAYKGVDENIRTLLNLNSKLFNEVNGCRLEFNKKHEDLINIFASQAEKLDMYRSSSAAEYSQLDSRLLLSAENQGAVLEKILDLLGAIKNTDLPILTSQVSELQRKSEEQTQVIRVMSTRKGFLFG